MMQFGETLRHAREARGLSTEDLAKATHMMTRQVEALEAEDFSRLAAPIYGRGFVKLYCEAVGLDTKMMIDAFMECYHASRAEKQSIVPPAPAPATALEPAPTPAPAPAPKPAPAPAPAVEPGAFSLESEVVKRHDPVPPHPGNPFAAMDEEPAGMTSPTPSRLVPPRPIDIHRPFTLPRLPRIPRRVRRIVILAVCAIALLYLILAGFRALYSAATNGAPAPERKNLPPDVKETPPPAKPARDVRTISPLYIDD